MNTLPDFFSSFLNKLPQPPAWLIAEGHNRIVLALNHVLQQEPEAMQRLARQKGRVVKFAWQQYSLLLMPTPVGLLAVAPQPTSTDARVDLLLEVTDTHIPELSQKLLRGDKPNVRIEGDIQLAAEVQWLAQNVTWDLEGDLARVVGNVPAHNIVRAVKAVEAKLREWLAK
jgi:ubiquinone biosynthesis accessory factor UbiJ